MDLLGIAPVVTGAAQTALNLGSSIGNAIQQAKNLDYQKAVQRQTWSREDTAVQRRVADLRAAGLSPTLAAGSAAQTSSPIRTEPVQFNSPDVKPVSQGVQDSLALMQQKANIAQTAAQTDLIKMQQFAAQTNVEKARQEILQNSLMNPLNYEKLKAYQPLFQRKAYSDYNAQEMRTSLAYAQKDKTRLEEFIRNFYFEEGTEWERDKELLRQIKIANDKNQYDLERWQTLGLPTNAGLEDSFTRLLLSSQGILSNIVDKLFGGER